VIEAEQLDEIPSYFYVPPPPPPSPVLMNLIEDRDNISIWSEGVTTLRIADIVEKRPTLKPSGLSAKNRRCSPIARTVRDFLLNINGEDVERSYSMSSSPLDPHVLEIR